MIELALNDKLKSGQVNIEDNITGIFENIIDDLDIVDTNTIVEIMTEKKKDVKI